MKQAKSILHMLQQKILLSANDNILWLIYFVKKLVQIIILCLFIKLQIFYKHFKKLELKIRESLESIPFKPEINKVSKYLAEVDPERANETADSKVQRLAEKVLSRAFVFIN
jgi:hypothetical protein